MGRRVLAATLAAGLVAALSAAPAGAAPGPATDVQLTISGPATGVGGGTFTYSTVVDNNGPADADGSVLTIELPAGATDLVVSCSANAFAACGGFTVAGQSVTGPIPALGFDIPTSNSGLVTVTVSGRFAPSGPSSVSASASVTLPDGMTDTNPLSNTTNVSTAVSYTGDVSVVKTQSTAILTAGTPIVYTVTVTNLGPSAVTNVGVVDNMTASGAATYLYEAFTSTFLDCGSTGGAQCPTFEATRSGALNNSNPFSAQFPVIPAGGALTFRYSVAFDAVDSPRCGGGATGAITNRASASGSYSDSNPANNSSAVVAQTGGVADCPQIDLQVTKTSDPAGSVDVGNGELVDFTVVFTNAGPASGTGATIADAMSGYLMSGQEITSLACVGGGGAVCPALASSADGTSVFNSSVDGAWPVGGTLTVTYTARIIAKSPDSLPSCADPADRFATNLAYVSAPDGVVDTVPENDQHALRLELVGILDACPSGDISAVKTLLTPLTADPNQTLTFRVTIRNTGPGTATSVGIADQLSLFSTWRYPVVISDAACTPGGGAQCPTNFAGINGSVSASASRLFQVVVPSIPGGGTLVLQYTVKPTFAAPAACTAYSFGYNNSAQVSLSLNEPFTDINFGNNFSQITATRFVPSTCTDVAITKTVDPTIAVVSGSVVYTLLVSNAGAYRADHVLIRDALPSFFQYSGSTCAAVTGAPVCPAITVTGNVLTATAALLAPGASLRITITGLAIGPDGTYPNTATAEATAASTYIESIPATNSSQVNTQVLPAPPSSIGDRVWSDTNGNGVQDAGEPGLAGVPVTLTGTDFLGAAVTLSAVTDADGLYLFPDLKAGTYTVSFPAVAGYVRAPALVGADPEVDSDGPTSTIVLAAGQNPRGIDSGYSATASVGNLVWADTNGNGVQDAGESGLADVTVSLLGPDGEPARYDDGSLVAAVVTGPSGAYGFAGLTPGAYTVVTSGGPAGYVRSPAGQGAAETDSQGSTAAVDLAPGANDDTIDFGYYRPAMIGNYVWIDSNGNGVQDDGESPLPGVSVTLTGTDGAGQPVVLSTTTDAEGLYGFTVPPGSYTVVFAPLADYVPTVADSALGNDGTDSDGGTVAVVVISGQVLDTIDSGFLVPAVSGTNLSIIKEAAAIGAVAPGDTVSYTLTVTNTGPASSHQEIVVADAAPSGLTITSIAAASVPGAGCVVAGGGASASCTLPISLAVGDTVVVAVSGTLAATAIGTLTNRATVTTVQIETTYADNTDTADVLVIVPAPPAPTVPAVVPSAPAAGNLAVTGADPAGTVLAATMITLAGLVLLAAGRRRRTTV